MRAIFPPGAYFLSSAPPFFFLTRRPIFSLTLKSHVSDPFSDHHGRPIFSRRLPCVYKKRTAARTIRTAAPLRSIYMQMTLRVSQLKDFETGEYSPRPRIILCFPTVLGDFYLKFDFRLFSPLCLLRNAEQALLFPLRKALCLSFWL